MGKPWTDHEDRQLLAWGRCMDDGYAFVAEHDLGRTEQEGRNRYAELCRTRPDLVREVEIAEAEADRMAGAR